MYIVYSFLKVVNSGSRREVDAVEGIFQKYSETFLANIWETLTTPDNYLNKLALTFAAFILLAIIRVYLVRWVQHSTSDEAAKFNRTKWVKNSLLFVFVLIVLTIWLQAMNAFLLILFSFVLFAIVVVRGLTENFIGWFVIERRNYFQIGSRIEMDGIVGDVLTVNPIHFELLEVRGDGLTSDTNTGRIIKVPNKSIFEKEIKLIGTENAFTWHELAYVLTYESDWQEAKEILVDAATSYYENYVKEPFLKQEHHWVAPDGGEPVFSLDTNDDGIVVKIRYLLNYHDGTSAKTYIQERVLTKFAQSERIDIAPVDIRFV